MVSSVRESVNIEVACEVSLIALLFCLAKSTWRVTDTRSTQIGWTRIHTYTDGHIGDRGGKPYLALRKNEGKLSEKPSILDLDLPPSRIR